MKKEDIDKEKSKQNLVEIVGFSLGFFDQISDILVIFSNQFADNSLYWGAVGIWIFNMIFVSIVSFKKVLKAKYWRPMLQIENIQTSQYQFARISEQIIKLIGSVLQFIIFIICCIIANAFTIILVWFGFTKLFNVNKKIYDLLSLILLDGQDVENKQHLSTTEKINSQVEVITLLQDRNIQRNVQDKDNYIHQIQLNNEQIKQTQKRQSSLEKKLELRNENIESEFYNNEQDKLEEYKEKTEIGQQQNNISLKNQISLQLQNNESCKVHYESQSSQNIIIDLDKDATALKMLAEFQFNMEFSEKIFENIPQLILQVINQSMGGSQNQVINILSIILAILNISFNIFSVVKMKSAEVQIMYEKALYSIKDFILDIPYLLICQFIQIALYIIVVYSYEWNDYASYKDTSYGKDADDSIRAFIIMYPLLLIITFVIGSKDSYSDFTFIPCLFKNSFLIIFLIDAWSFQSEHLKYGQQILGTTGFIIFTILSFLSIVDRIILMQKAKYYDESKVTIETVVLLSYMGIIYFIKSFSQFINNAHYYDWAWYEDKVGDCNEYLEKTLQGVLIIYVFRYFIHAIGIFVGGTISLIFIIFQLVVITGDSMLLYFQINYSYCDDLRYVQRHYYTIILDITAGAIGILTIIYKAKNN